MITYLLDNDTIIRSESKKDIGDMIHAKILDENNVLINVSGRVIDTLEDYEDWNN